jgi:hypothetical protein
VPFASPGALDRARFFVGVGAYGGRAGDREIRIFDMSTWPASAPFGRAGGS